MFFGQFCDKSQKVCWFVQVEMICAVLFKKAVILTTLHLGLLVYY